MGKLVRLIAQLTPKQRAKVGLDERLMDEIERLTTMKVAAAYGRLVRTITSEMRRMGVDEKDVRLAYDRGKGISVADDALRSLAERWLDDLMSQGDRSLQKFSEAYTQVDRPTLRQSIRSLHKARKELSALEADHKNLVSAKNVVAKNRKRVMQIIFQAFETIDEIVLP